MTVLVTPDEMHAAEAAAIAAGRPEPELMRAAALGIAAWVDDRVVRRGGRGRYAVALVGPGNNGGDALVTLALLIERGWRCGAIFLGRAQPGPLPAEPSSLQQIERVGIEGVSEADVILDGVFGVGSRSSLPGEVAAVFRVALETRIRRGTPLVAIDVPSGTDPGSGAADADTFRADVTLCLGLPKIGLVREPAATHVGELIVIDIGIPLPEDDGRPQLITEDLIRPLLPRRSASAHKHAAGAVLVVGGAPSYYGAPRLSAEAAMRVGAGLVCVAVPESIVPVIAAQVPELVFLPLPSGDGLRAAGEISEWIEGRRQHVKSIVVGPGLGQEPRVDVMLDALFATRPAQARPAGRDSHSLRYVIDADGLNWIARSGGWPMGIPEDCAVMTPHPGEMARLLDTTIDDVLRDPIQTVRHAANHFKQVVILKFGFAPVAAPDGRVRVSPRATSELATAGTGDVLAGQVGGFLAQGLAPVQAACTALYVGAAAGSRARGEYGALGVMATDLIERIPHVLARLTEPRWRE